MAAAARLLAALVVAAAAAGAEEAPRPPAPDRPAREAGLGVPRITGPAQLYARHCQGCHGHRGISVVEVPALKGRAGWFAHTPEGRAYLVLVPGVALAHMGDAELADLLNWMLRTYSAGELPENFPPYTAEEVGALRCSPVNDISGERAAVIRGLIEAGVIADAAQLGFGSDRRY